jgi:hypothetical protein
VQESKAVARGSLLVVGAVTLPAATISISLASHRHSYSQRPRTPRHKLVTRSTRPKLNTSITCLPANSPCLRCAALIEIPCGDAILAASLASIPRPPASASLTLVGARPSLPPSGCVAACACVHAYAHTSRTQAVLSR